jgi:outer membrane protein assembly factor BamB
MASLFPAAAGLFRSGFMCGMLVAGLSGWWLAMAVAAAGEWTQWRGPQHNNVAESGQTVPLEWDSKKNVVWKADVPGRGHSSPIVFGSMVVLTTADDRSQQQAVVAFDRATGRQLWLTVISEGGFAKIHAKNTYASATPATDGKSIYATFCHHEKIEAVAVDLQGKILWRQDAGGFRPKAYEYGYAASPTIFGSTLIINADCDTIAWLKALDTQTGRVVWETPRELMLNWSSPIVASVGGREQLLLSGTERIASYDPQTGKSLWEARCLTMATCGTVVWDGDIVFASGGFPDPETAAVRADGSGKVLWTNRVKCYEQSMLAQGGYLYAFSDNGIVYCWDGATGKEQWSKRLQGPVSSSPLLVGDTIFATNEAGTTWVFKATPEAYTQVARNQLGDSGFASMVAVDGRIYIRTTATDGSGRRESLYCIGQP